MANRVNNELCVGCGNPLVYPFNEYRLCNVCLPKVGKSIYETKMHKPNKNSKTRIRIPLHSHIMLTREPLGQKVNIA